MSKVDFLYFNFFFAFFKRVRSTGHVQTFSFVLALTQSVDRCVVITEYFQKLNDFFSSPNFYGPPLITILPLFIKYMYTLNTNNKSLENPETYQQLN